jgi:HD-like signal output (HDOD) protein
MTAAATTRSTPNFVHEVTAGRVELPTIPRVVHKLMAALRDPDVDARVIGKELAGDPVLSAKVLRLANSSFFGGQRSMASIDQAVAMVGTQAIGKLVMACGVSQAFEEVRGIDLRTFWRDAVVAASAGQKVAARLDADADAAYTCGLLHATGHLILCKTYPEVAAGMFEGYAVLRGAELAKVEAECFGIDHATVGSMWAESLGFPQEVADAIRLLLERPAEGDTALLLVLRGACTLAAAVAGQQPAEAAFAALPARVRNRYAAADGKPDVAFFKLHESLLETEPVL